MGLQCGVLLRGRRRGLGVFEGSMGGLLRGRFVPLELELVMGRVWH